MDKAFLMSPLERMMEKSDVVYYANDGLTIYLGFCQPKTESTAEAKWSVCRVQSSGSAIPYTQTIMWAGGTNVKRFAFDDCQTLNYSFRKF